ncbi:UvrD-helicase domain-containing protein [Wolbachia endosymbiont of Drosophila aff. chauvacae BK-2020]|uniref:UvrD-helicase domain-containing protein n=1 Tax=unclassified Wolbachia TaxID=2640676 RepID=UPI0023A93E80|nr:MULTISPECIES: UvrD-helicase domain-containing protein [unclassified Wolbachia]MDE5059607.1 UvrD-helicase domain-containing protein [Wolbachia endosymbiont of Drosophila burlai]MDE5063702.1 UvrD-helicase domain-containing protein [Wolbachia endosymbiont of Drosophila chauvacae]MDU8909628.1 UvrD-helicase domain-containing protein [Wolbachia endosymbiont of Drosophila bocqueti]WOE62442.1 UvrD-helicase domain-containing protein [Wolbachia endosymbiont of Drosophila aff. chauvacae BK-2020]
MRSNAINPNFSVWVNASAGTGKTKILIDRVLRLLLENKRNILCLTFTNAAANEMENRIHSILSKWAICSDSVLAADLEQLDFFPMSSQCVTLGSQHPYLSSQCVTLGSRKNKDYLTRARRLFSELENLGLTIQTIHAFCYKLISSFPIEAGIAPNCTLSECKELHSIIFNKVLHNETVQDDINLIATEIDENKLRDLLYTLCVKRSASANDSKYIKDKLSAPDEIHDLQSETIEHVERLAEILSEGSKRDQSYSEILDSTVIPAGIQKKRTSVTRWNDTKVENLAKVFLKSESHEKKSISSIATKSILEKFKDAEQIIESVQNVVFTHIRDMNFYQIFKRTSSLLGVFKVYVDLYNSEKSKNALLDYNDIINLATNLLSNPNYKDWILFNLDQKIDHILVDEAQDNSISQWKIITNLCDEFFAGNDEKRTLFVVGDVKQSIYRFQGANPHLFNYMQQYFHTKTGGRDWISCQLEKSFRSTPEVLMLVDRIFNNFRAEISFNDNEIKHVPHRENDQGYIEIWPALPRRKEKEQQALQIPLTCRENYIIADRLLAQTIANRIHNWLNEGRILVAKDRHIEPRDIMILVRQRNVLVDYIISELKKANVPVVGRDYFRIMDYIAVQDLIALAEFLLLQANDLALANALKSPLFNFTEDDLFNIAYDRKEHSLWERIQDYSVVIYSELNYLINLSRIESPLALFTHILRTGKKKFAARLGLECFEVLDEFMNLVLQFENPSLQAFVQWIKENNPEIKNDMQSERNAVRIMTIHKSKGLQAPIVFLVDTNTVPRNSESIIFDGTEVPFWCGKNNNAYCDQVKREKKLEDYNEYLRLLYVALTRAEDELYILSKEPVQKGSWYDLITKYGEPYEKKQRDLQPIFKEKVEVLCVNANYPYIYKKRDYFDVPVISLPPALAHSSVSSQRVTLESSEKEGAEWIPVSATWMTDGYARGLIIHSILQYMPKIEKERRKNWVRKYLDNISEDKDEIYSKILAFNEKYGYLFDLEGKSEITLSGTIDGKSVLVRLDRLCITQDKAIIIDYKSHRNVSVPLLNEIKKQMLIYKTLVQEIYPNKQVECVVIWVEDLTIQSDF